MADSQFEREEEDIQRRYAAGEISNAEMWAEQKALQRSVRAELEDAARDAYDRVMGDGGW